MAIRGHEASRASKNTEMSSLNTGWYKIPHDVLMCGQLTGYIAMAMCPVFLSLPWGSRAA